MTSYHNPETIAAPTGLFSHAVECAAGARWLHVSGLIGNVKAAVTNCATEAVGYSGCAGLKVYRIF